MKSIVTIFCSILITLHSVGQVNLVPNPSFEDTASCPTGGSAIDLAIGWSSYRESADYFNACNASFVNVPINFAGNQFAKDGSAYAGIICYYYYLINAREFIGIQLLQPLNPGQKYFASFYASMGFNTISSRMGIASNNLGIKLSTVPFSSFDSAPIDNNVSIYSNSIVLDSTNWIKISGSFIADSAYDYLIIGNFFTDSASTISILDSTAIYSYYYLDQVTLSTDSALVNQISNEIHNEHIIISPNPASDEIEISGEKIESFYLSNLFGEIVYQRTNIKNWPIRINVTNLRKGVYFLNSFNSNLSYCNKIIIY